MSDPLVKETCKLREHNLFLKESLKYLEEVNKSFKIKINKIRNSREECKHSVLLIEEVTDLCEILGKLP